MISVSSVFAAEQAKPNRTPIYQVFIGTRTVDIAAATGAAAYWKMDELSGVRADSIGDAHLGDVNTVGSATGKISNAAQFVAASSECLSFTPTPDSPLWRGDTGFSGTLWVYLDSVATDRTFISQYESGGGGWAVQYDQGNNKFRFFIVDSGLTVKNCFASTFGAPSISTWYFLAWTFDATANLMTISVNAGTRDSTATVAVYPPIGTNPFLIGAHNGSGTPTSFHSGRIDEVGFWTRVLSVSEEGSIYNGGNGLSPSAIEAGSHFCNANPVGELIGEPLLVPLALEQRADIENSSFPLSTFTFRLQDHGGVVSALVASGVEGKFCDFYLSFRSIPFEANKVLRFRGIITEIPVHTQGYFEFTARSLMAAANDKLIFDGAQTTLTAAINSSDVTLSVVDASAFSPTASDANKTFALIIDKEFVFPRGSTSTTFTSVLRLGANNYAVPPVMPDSASTSHVINSVVREMVTLGQLTGTNSDSGTNDMHPIDLLRIVLNVVPSVGVSWGVMAKARLDRLVETDETSLTAAQSALGSTLMFRFQESEAINAKTFLEEQIFQALGSYPRENNAGQLGMKLYQAASDASPVDTITDADILDWPRWLRNAERLLNTASVDYDHNPVTDKSSSQFTYQADDLVTANGRVLPFFIASKGIRGTYSQVVPVPLTWFGATPAFLTDMAQRTIARFGGKAPVFSVQTSLRKQLLEMGDDIESSFSNVVDIDSGSRSVTNKKCEVQYMKHDYVENVIDFEVMAYPED